MKISRSDLLDLFCETLTLATSTLPGAEVAQFLSQNLIPKGRCFVQIEQFEIRPYGKQLIRVWGAIVDGKARVAAELPDNFLLSAVSMGTEDARRFAQQIIEACEAAERAAQGIGAKR